MNVSCLVKAINNDMDDYKERVELDDWYVLNFSLRNDIMIILKTVRCMFTGKGAY